MLSVSETKLTDESSFILQIAQLKLSSRKNGLKSAWGTLDVYTLLNMLNFCVCVFVVVFFTAKDAFERAPV